MKKIILFCLFLISTLIFLTDDGFSIPAFARKYQYSCTTCHAPAPHLKPFGEEFAANGFKLTDETQEPKRATIDTGDPILKLLREFPLAARIEGFAAYKEDAKAEADFQWPWAFKILSGGAISDKVSYYFYYIIEKGGESGLEDAYLQFNKPFGLPLDLIFGQYQISDPIFKRELRLERNDYMIYKVTPGYSNIKLTYDRGISIIPDLKGALDLSIGIFNGSGLKEAEGDLNDYDTDRDKSLSLRLAKEIGPLRVGLFGYYGKEEKILYETPEYYESTKNKVTYFGPDLVINFSENFQINLQYLKRKDTKGIYEYLFDGAEVGEMNTKGGFAEILWLPAGLEGRYAFSILYNNIDSDDENSIYENASLTFNYLIARNIRFLSEFQRDIEKKKNSLILGVSAAF
ncbi:MAG: hypothetical protein WHV67_07840 [Thermoanaerobaculia bacterium]